MIEKLMQMTRASGCAAKINPKDLENFLSKIKQTKDKRLLAGLEHNEDAAVYKLDENTGIVFTLDLITPLVNDPYVFGQIAATNSLSDVFAMGGRPLMALNIVCFPEEEKKYNLLEEILRGGADKVAEAGGILAGGHSLNDKEPKYGLAVVGLVDPKKVIYNNTPEVGDFLILTKPLGVGIISTAIKGEIAEKRVVDKAVFWMTKLNKLSQELLELNIHSLTDVTGFGLVGHLSEMLLLSGKELGAKIMFEDIPVIEGVYDYVNTGMVSEGAMKNRKIYSCIAEKNINLSFEKEIVLYDPQTSGGLLISIDPQQVEKAIKLLHQEGFTESKIIGEVIKSKSKERIKIC
ncbi:MAG: selenide, water dikinase SelD [bacterium]|uniref:Selenide, water dikinase n=1 Tax=Candidatus Infernicultor aquiphilus TaxID=1805029 RepID=A0A2M8CDU2_9BACT|nr:selenide, water dikinase SelD [bacterium]PIU24646.1 MAG: selenide, water dikinase SelD [Candidatus Atribacteria bacterium CG08_land_8_20_14_0_20_33_29]PIW12359.1 MAG: selenide, water dikinase SelD [Candidatus Atribacteria bacterium CG17_big_fil_post_rev_8_21_14_2_50_34_11]PJB57235.1 MAG: selenide, water dikinase SelD [Candidatus Atribacteria bacterium CG_4_9_14_3_um_filter_33_16]